MIEIDQIAVPRKQKFYQILYVQVVVAIVIGILLGLPVASRIQLRVPGRLAIMKLIRLY